MYQYPYGNAQQLNLDWLMEQWQTVKQSIDGSLQGEIDRVEAAITDLLNARDAAVAAAGAANTSAGAAAQSAQAAAGDAATAAAQAAAANTARSNAAQAANNAQQYAGNAQTQAAAAQNAAGQAAASASDAHDDAVAASGSAVNAAASAAGALQNFQLSDAARQAAQAAEQDAEAAATLLQPPATSADIGKALIVKTVGGGTVTAYELGESGGGGTPAIVNTIEDVAIASFDEGTVNPVQQLVVDIEPVQGGSGDPAPDNVRPITGWTGENVYRTGVNVWDEQPELGLLESDGSVSSSTTRLVSSFIPVKAGETYVFRWPSTFGRGRGAFYDADKNLVQYESDFPPAIIELNVSQFTVPTNACYMRFNLTTSYGPTYNNDISINYPSTDHDYHAHTGTIYPLAFPDEAGTVYGGTLTNLGANEWKLRVDWVSRTYDGSELWQESSSTNPVYFVVWNQPESIGMTDLTQLGNWVTAGGQAYQPFGKYRAQANGGVVVGNLINGEQGNYKFATAADFKAYLVDHPLQVCYKVADPVEYTITTADVIQLLSGYNNIWADTGNINLLQYYADSKRYIDEQDTLVKALIAPVLDNMIADTALTANDFRIVDNTLYRITTSVAAGAALTPNTNCTATTIGAILKTLLT